MFAAAGMALGGWAGGALFDMTGSLAAFLAQRRRLPTLSGAAVTRTAHAHTPSRVGLVETDAQPHEM